MRELAAHTAAVYQHKTTTIADGWTDASPPYPTEVRDATGDEVVGVLADSLDALVDVLASADMDRPVYTWCEHDHTVQWWVRRMAHESLIHAADAYVGVGLTPTCDAWLAADGVEEALVEFIVGAPAWAEVTSGGRRVDLVGGGRRWSLRSSSWSGSSPSSGTVYSNEPALVFATEGDVDATLSLDAVTLNYWLWGRLPAPDGAIDGDGELIAYVRSVAAAST